jgi:hypothetical protein
MDILDRCLSQHTHIQLIALTQDTPETAKLLDSFGYTVQMQTPVDPDSLFTLLCDILGIDYGGRIRGISIASFLQMLELDGTNCTVRLTQNRKTGWLYCLSGVIIDAQTDTSSGKEAAFKLLGMENPIISIEYGTPNREKTIDSSLMGLLLESGRINDEMKVKTSERRRYTRFICSSPAELEYNEWSHNCVANNLSLSGVFLLTKGPFPTGKQVIVSFFSHTLNQTCKISGSIVRKNSDGIGIEFSKLSVNQKSVLRKVVEESVAI